MIGPAAYGRTVSSDARRGRDDRERTEENRLLFYAEKTSSGFFFVDQKRKRTPRESERSPSPFAGGTLNSFWFFIFIFLSRPLQANPVSVFRRVRPHSRRYTADGTQTRCPPPTHLPDCEDSSYFLLSHHVASSNPNRISREKRYVEIDLR